MSVPSSLPHRRALDGVRGVAVVAVLLFHAGKLKGGYLGVDLFFVLSGYLITSLLLAESGATGRVNLPGFWARRARRLLPALFLVVAFVGLYSAVIADPSELHRIRGDALATLAYVANWRFVFGHFDYFALFSSPSPLNHTWSLAIEEQFYLVWPLAFAGVLVWRRRRHPVEPDRAALARATFLLASVLTVASAILALGLWAGRHDATRIYYGTDTRAPAILLGAALAGLLAWRGPARSIRARAMLEVAAGCGAVGLAVAWTRLAGAGLYRGGLLACAIAAGAVIAAAAHPQPGPLARALSWRPFVGLGVISYGVYLWHWPIYLWLDADRVGVDGWALLAVRVAVTLPVAIVSFVAVERPIRHGALSRSTLRWVTPLAAGFVVAVTVFAATGYASPVSEASSGITDAGVGIRRAGNETGAKRLMVVGNSVGYFLAGEGLSAVATDPPTVTLNAGLVACVYPDGDRLRTETFGDGQSPIPCDQGWGPKLREFHPDVVLMVFSDSGGGQLLHHGSWLSSCDREFRDWYLQTLDGATRLLSSEGARIVMTTSPYSFNFNAPVDTLRQTDCKNTLTREFAQNHPAVALVDFAAYMCPTRATCRTHIHGVQLRKDGVHFRGVAAQIVAKWLITRLGLGLDVSSRP